jgi:DNA invertase Pin-like site-specific DNA recombinase
MTRRGRPTVLTEDVLARIAELRAKDMGYGTIARSVGVGKSTVYRVLHTPAFLERFQNSESAGGGDRR